MMTPHDWQIFEFRRLKQVNKSGTGLISPIPILQKNDWTNCAEYCWLLQLVLVHAHGCIFFLHACAVHQGHQWYVNSAAFSVWGVSSILAEQGCSLWTPPALPAPAVLSPAPQFGHSQTAAGLVGSAGTNKDFTVELALPQPSWLRAGWSVRMQIVIFLGLDHLLQRGRDCFSPMAVGMKLMCSQNLISWYWHCHDGHSQIHY